MNRLLTFMKNETVLVISLFLALISALWIPPNRDYIEYIDVRTLVLLFCLMVVMSGFSRLGFFDMLAKKLLSKARTDLTLSLILVTLCFFSSMLITNDVALITFVPFTIITLEMVNRQDKLIFIVTLETIAANLGSMLTPVGNPQNLYLFFAFQMDAKDFFSTIFPFAGLSYILLILSCFFVGNTSIAFHQKQEETKMNGKLFSVYVILFLLSLLSVFRVFHYLLLLCLLLIIVAVLDRKTLVIVDYSLIFTFLFLFVFVGNLGEVEEIRLFLEQTVTGNEVLTSILASQVLSNVPTAILLSGFTNEASALLIGVNLGGLGTLIASMASLISFKFIQKTKESTSRYFFIFSLMNIVFLLVLYVFWIVIY